MKLYFFPKSKQGSDCLLVPNAYRSRRLHKCIRETFLPSLPKLNVQKVGRADEGESPLHKGMLSEIPSTSERCPTHCLTPGCFNVFHYIQDWWRKAGLHEGDLAKTWKRDAWPWIGWRSRASASSLSSQRSVLQELELRSL